MLKFLKEFSLISQSEKLISYTSTYFLMALASHLENLLDISNKKPSNQELTLDLEMQVVESPKNRKRTRDQCNAVISQKIDHLKTILTRLFSLLNNTFQ